MCNTNETHDGMGAKLDGTAPNNLSTREAITIARDWISTQNSEVAEILQMILDQRGCEDLDPAVTDGHLTTFMDVVIFG